MADNQTTELRAPFGVGAIWIPMKPVGNAAPKEIVRCVNGRLSVRNPDNPKGQTTKCSVDFLIDWIERHQAEQIR